MLLLWIIMEETFLFEPPPLQKLQKKTHTPFWNHSGRWTTLYSSRPVGFNVAVPCRRSLKKVCSCFLSTEEGAGNIGEANFFPVKLMSSPPPMDNLPGGTRPFFCRKRVAIHSYSLLFTAEREKSKPRLFFFAFKRVCSLPHWGTLLK